MRQIDLAIIGGGFAGLVCAQAAAVRGAKTVVFERKPFIGAKPHTTGILVKEVADRFDFPEKFVRKIHKVRLYSPNLNFIDLHSPGYYFLATDTTGLLGWLAEQAANSGAEIRCDSTFRDCQKNPQGWSLPDFTVSARYLVGADGARSRLASTLQVPANRKFLLGVEQEWDNVRGLEPDFLHVFLDSHFARGYIGWAVPGVHGTQIGLATSERHAPRLDEFIGRLRKIFDFGDATCTGQRGGLIPAGGTLHHPPLASALLLGDAAGTVSPLTAGGIHPALELGRLAGVAIANHLLDGGPDPWQQIRRQLPSYAFKNLLRRGFETLTPPNALLDFALNQPLFRRFAQTVFFHHRGLLTLEAWRDLLRLPDANRDFVSL
ncbi:MAG: NAD(P)/FAD-dependent oxidoreductase [Verrucomicrobiales bacterium]|jgi:flavin-dependent dehydrogenase|nr:NAD(P)/FAD-dependent oxidoreductase [Verrucomicrobiales bacterium]